MNNWKESAWFKTWLDLAREGQNAVQGAQRESCDMTPGDRLNLKTVGTIETSPNAELQVTE
jgi:hypothetical protein